MVVNKIFTTLGVVCLCRLTNGGGAWSRDKVQVRLHTEHGGTFIVVGNMQDMSEADEERVCISVWWEESDKCTLHSGSIS